MSTRRIHLQSGRRPQFAAGDEGRERPRLVVHGRTEGGGEYEIVLVVDDWSLGTLAVDIRDHFVQRSKNEESQRQHRERALRMPPKEGA